MTSGPSRTQPNGEAPASEPRRWVARDHWVASWATAPLALDGPRLAGRTVRTVCRVGLGGHVVRVRLSNVHGDSELRVIAVTAALRDVGSRVDGDTLRTVRFAGQTAVTVPAGGTAASDAVDLVVPALAEVAVSVHVEATGAVVTGHDDARQTCYLSASDRTDAVDPVVDEEIEQFLVVGGVDVRAPRGAATVVAFGDSLTEGSGSGLDANHRWPDRLAQRLHERSVGRPTGVVNLGTGGGRLLRDGRGTVAFVGSTATSSRSPAPPS